jgi:hypothetical protein
MISDYTRDICRWICIERATEMEIRRLDWKLKILKVAGKLSSAEARWDAEQQDDVRSMFEAGKP